MEKPNARLEAMLVYFAQRTTYDLQLAVQLRAAVTASEQTVHAFNHVANSEVVRSFSVASGRHSPNLVGHFDADTQTVSLPMSAFRHEGDKPSDDLIAACRVQSMITSFAVTSTKVDGTEQRLVPTPEMVRNLQDVINESPKLAQELMRASISRDPVNPANFALERFELIPPDANVGGMYVGPTHTMQLPYDDLDQAGTRRFNPV